MRESIYFAEKMRDSIYFAEKMRESIYFAEKMREAGQCLGRPTCQCMTRELSRTISLEYQTYALHTLASMCIPANDRRRRTQVVI